MKVLRFLIAAVIGFAIQPSLNANDSAASTAAGGIQLKREPRISMEREKLTISLKKITVEYEFLNESDQDITTEVAFPVPPYKQNMSPGGIRDFNRFRLWVNGTQQKYKVQVKATLNSIDCSAVLRKYGIDIASLGHYEDAEKGPLSQDFFKLSKAAQDELVKQGLFFLPDPENPFPEWAVEKTYYWRQTFPAHKILHVSHQYEAGVGFEPVSSDEIRSAETKAAPGNRAPEDSGYPSDDQFAYELQAACVDSRVKSALLKSIQDKSKDESYIYMSWVDYILVTANNWKTPIRNFELIVKNDSRPDYSSSLVSFCWNGKVERTGQNEFRATATDFVPKADLHIAFFDLPKPEK